MDENECAEHLYKLLSESVKMRMISDVPLGAFLSGGIDSSIIVGLMAEHSSLPVKTFSIGFTEGEFNELEYARIIAENFGTDHHEHIVTSDVKDLMLKLIWYFNEPVGDSSAIPTYYVSKMTRQSVTVALSGDGGDELFAGYGKYPIINRIIHSNSFEKKVRKIISSHIIRKDLMPSTMNNFFYRLQLALKYRFSTAEERDFLWINHFDNFSKNDIYSHELVHLIKKDLPRKFYDSQLQSSINQNPLNRINIMDLTAYLPDDLLVKVDIASMANSLEVRSPFLDHKFVEFAVGVPNSFKLRNGDTKYILKKAFTKLLPQQIIERKKMGFSIPVDKWFRYDLKEFSYETLLYGNKEIKEYFNKKFMKYLLDAHCSGARNYGTQLWLLINFALWYDMFVNQCRISDA
jgi:asparagine synthase (glutamine-hydrolysing)